MIVGPETPQHKAADGGMRERDRHVIAQVIGLQLLVVGVDVEFGGLNRQAELAEPVQKTQQPDRRRQNLARLAARLASQQPEPWPTQSLRQSPHNEYSMNHMAARKHEIGSLMMSV